MKNSEFKVNDNIMVQGNKGIIVDIMKCREYIISYNGKPVHNGRVVLNDNNARETIANGYTLEKTGRTATYFKVKFVDSDLINTVYDNEWYGCIDTFENYCKW